MNDFTKEELNWLRWEIEEGLKYETDNMPFKLRDKIQSMIDDYCEHNKCKHEWVSLFVIDEDNLRVLGGTGYKCLVCNRIIPAEWGKR